MRPLDLQKFQELQSNPDCIRNICILAHVDHGKTTLADSLVASNGIISNKLAGKLRYLDSRPDEQLRGITMKSSLITLYHVLDSSEFIINLIDSPGHVDFSSEVSTAVRLCDGAIIMVDAVEGVCPQTRSALSIAYDEGLKPLLVLNKIDRLITEMKLSPLDAYVHLNQVLEQVNAVMGELFASDMMDRDDEEKKEKPVSSTTDNLVEKNLADWQSALEEADDSHLYFSPEQGNVLFASAIDGWGFSVNDFAKIFSKKLGCSEKVLSKTLWGDYYFDSKEKKIMKGAQKKAKKPLCVQLILENLWALYDTVVVRRDKEKIVSMVEKLNIKLTTRDLRHTDPKAQLHAICAQWLPLAKACLDMASDKVPSPHKLPKEKIRRLISGADDFSSMPEETRRLEEAFLACKSNETAPVIIFISKMFPVDKKSLPENRPKPLTQEELVQRREIARQRHADRLEKEKLDEAVALKNPEASTEKESSVEEEEEDTRGSCLIAFARVYSGTVGIGSELYVLGPKHDPRVALERERAGEVVDSTIQLKDLKAGRHITKVSISKLYLLMGRELEPITKVPAGNVIGIGNLEEHVLKTATLSSTIACPSFSELTSLADPILRVALEPKHPNDLQKLINGLKMLNQADACALVHIQESGEIILNTAGEVHLERCLEDLKLRYAKVEVNVSEPIVSFRETVVLPPKVDVVHEAIEKKSEDVKIEIWTWDRQCYFEIDAKPLPEKVTKLLEDNAELIKGLDKHSSGKHKEEISSDIDECQLNLEASKENEKMQKSLETFKIKLANAFKEEGWPDEVMNQIWSFGPRKCGPNILLNESSFVRQAFWEQQSKSTDSRETYVSSIFSI